MRPSWTSQNLLGLGEIAALPRETELGAEVKSRRSLSLSGHPGTPVMPLTGARPQDGGWGHWWVRWAAAVPSPPVSPGLSQPRRTHGSPATHTSHLGPSQRAGYKPGSWEADGALRGPGQGFLAGWGRASRYSVVATSN